MGAQFFAVYVAASYVDGNHSAHRTLDMIDTVRHDIVEKYPNDFMFATTAADIRRAHKMHKIAALMGIEGGHAIEDSPRILRDYYALGVRYMTLTHVEQQSLGRLLGRRQQAQQRPFSVGQRDCARDEPAGHDRGHLARFRQDVFRRAGDEPGSDLRIALFVPGDFAGAAEYDR